MVAYAEAPREAVKSTLPVTNSMYPVEELTSMSAKRDGVVAEFVATENVIFGYLVPVPVATISKIVGSVLLVLLRSKRPAPGIILVGLGG